ncbi:MAG: TVP38/TMEM64 family protein [Clostridiaceae bacterium]|nr:TVP38/TMEM64 family protein [Clostridiaceae bacterium]
MEDRNKVSRIKFYMLILLALITLIIVILNWKYIKSLSAKGIVDFIRNQGVYAELTYLLIFVLKPFLVVIPSNIIAITGGIIFGPVEGFLLSMLGFFISGTIAFYISRLLGKDFVQSIIGDKFIKLDKNIREHGFRIMFLLRLPPVLPYDPLSYTSGFTNIYYKDFILASVLGVVPETLCYSILGPNFSTPWSPKFIIPLLIIVIATIMSKKVMDLRNK